MSDVPAAIRRLDRLGAVTFGRPRLAITLLVWVLVFAIALLSVPTLGWRTTALVAWDVAVVAFLLMAIEMMLAADTAAIRWRAANQDVGETVFAIVIGVVAAISLAAIYAELKPAGQGANATVWQLLLCGITVILSWLFVQFFFAFHYAHKYYGQGGGKSGGLCFPQGSSKEPDYWDFLYFSLVIGMTSQVSDVGVSDRRIRHTVTWHGVYAFFFNVALIALVVNLAADIIKRG
jgi:uncharacterized membrane protein